MIRNRVIKNILINTVFNFFTVLNKIIPKNSKLILIYGDLGFRDNLKILYDYLIEKGYEKKYKIIISANVNYKICNISRSTLVVNNFVGVLLFFISGHVFYAFGKIPIEPTKDQIVIHMGHGAPFKGPDKAVLDSARMSKKFYSKVFVPSPLFIDIQSFMFSCDKTNIAICGQPRSDLLFNNKKKYNELLPYKKNIVWLPTFRRSSILGYNDSDDNDYIVPLFNYDELKKLNEFLHEKECNLIIKLHPCEDLNNYKELNISNISLLDNNTFLMRKWDLYELLAQSDALITDYSSVFYDYLLINKPIGFILSDFEQYNKKRGFSIENPLDFLAGEKIFSISDFYLFISNVIDNIDKYNQERKRVNLLVNTFTDGENRKRALELSNINL